MPFAKLERNFHRPFLLEFLHRPFSERKMTTPFLSGLPDLVQGQIFKRTHFGLVTIREAVSSEHSQFSLYSSDTHLPSLLPMAWQERWQTSKPRSHREGTSMVKASRSMDLSEQLVEKFRIWNVLIICVVLIQDNVYISLPPFLHSCVLLGTGFLLLTPTISEHSHRNTNYIVQKRYDCNLR